MPIKDVEHLGMIAPVRCPCGQVIAPAANEYLRLIRSGRTKKEALENCGLPTRSPLLQQAPASECCNAYLMCYIDSTPIHMMYHEVAQIAENKHKGKTQNERKGKE